MKQRCLWAGVAAFLLCNVGGTWAQTVEPTAPTVEAPTQSPEETTAEKQARLGNEIRDIEERIRIVTALRRSLQSDELDAPVSPQVKELLINAYTRQLETLSALLIRTSAELLVTQPDVQRALEEDGVTASQLERALEPLPDPGAVGPTPFPPSPLEPGTEASAPIPPDTSAVLPPVEPTSQRPAPTPPPFETGKALEKRLSPLCSAMVRDDVKHKLVVIATAADRPIYASCLREGKMNTEGGKTTVESAVVRFVVYTSHSLDGLLLRPYGVTFYPQLNADMGVFGSEWSGAKDNAAYQLVNLYDPSMTAGALDNKQFGEKSSNAVVMTRLLASGLWRDLRQRLMELSRMDGVREIKVIMGGIYREPTILTGETDTTIETLSAPSSIFAAIRVFGVDAEKQTLSAYLFPNNFGLVSKSVDRYAVSLNDIINVDPSLGPLLEDFIVDLKGKDEAKARPLPRFW